MAVRPILRQWTQQPQEAVRSNVNSFPGLQRLYLPQSAGLVEVVRNVAVTAVFAGGSSITAQPSGYGLTIPTSGSVKDADDELAGIGSQLTAWVYLRPRTRTASDFVFGRILSNGAASGTGYSFGLYWAGTGAQAYVRNAAGTVVSTTAVAITTNVPQLWALTYDGATLRVYAGSATASAAQTGLVRSSANEDIAFGGWGVAPTVAFDVYAAGIDNTVYSAEQIRALSDNPWSAFEPKRIWVPMAASGPATHATSGALVGQGSSVAGAALRARAHPASGALAGQGAAVAGSAARATPGGAHDTTGALTGQGSTVAGSAAHIAKHAASGVLTGQGSVVAGAAARVGGAVTHATSGAIVGPGPLVNGNAVGPGRSYSGGFPRRQQARKGYIIKGERYWLTEDELSIMVAQMLVDVGRTDVQEVTAGKPKPISKRVWKAVKAAQPVMSEDEDEDETIMVFI